MDEDYVTSEPRYIIKATGWARFTTAELQPSGDYWLTSGKRCEEIRHRFARRTYKTRDAAEMAARTLNWGDAQWFVVERGET
jgi:hypothetical protein